MGCASSSPLMNGAGGPGGVVDTIKNQTSDVLHKGEEAMHGVGETITETYDQVKDTLTGAVGKVTHGVEDLIHSKKHEVDETVSQETKAISETIIDTMDKANNGMDDAEALTDKAMRETEDVMNDVFDTSKVSITESIDKDIDKINRELNGSLVNLKNSNSSDSLKLQSPEPEIEKILSNDDSRRSPTPPPTIIELPELTKTTYFKRESLLTTTITEENELEIIKSDQNPSNDDNVMKHKDDDDDVGDNDYDFDSIDKNNNNDNGLSSNSRSNSIDKNGNGNLLSSSTSSPPPPQSSPSPSGMSQPPPNFDELTYWEKLADAIVHIPINTFEKDVAPITELTDSNENILELIEDIWEDKKD